VGPNESITLGPNESIKINYGVAGNRNALQAVYERVVRAWRQWLNRRSQRARMHWRTFTALLRRYPLPRPVLLAVPSGVVQGVLF